MNRIFTVIALLLLALPHASMAAPVTWFLQDVFLDNGASVTGSFVLDEETFRLTSADITVANRPLGDAEGWIGPVLSVDPFTYRLRGSPNGTTGFTLTETWVLPPDWDGEQILCVSNPLACGRSLELDFESSLISGLSTVPIDIGFGSKEFVGNLVIGRFDTASIVSGSVTAIPVPAAAWLFASALFPVIRRASRRIGYRSANEQGKRVCQSV